MKRPFVVIAFAMLALVANAITLPTFDEMKAMLDAKSLPIVNLTVDIAKVSKPKYTTATIEIVDPMARTEGQADITYNCKVKYRGNTSLNYDKK